MGQWQPQPTLNWRCVVSLFIVDFCDISSQSREILTIYAASVVKNMGLGRILLCPVFPRRVGIGSMKVTVEEGDEQFLQQLHQAGGGTVHELCDAAGVTATAIRQRLNRLQGLGLVERQTVRAGRGRPHHSYRLTDAGQRQLGDNYAELAAILWDELGAIEEPSVRERVKNRIREALTRRYGETVHGESLTERFGQLKSSLSSRGFHVEVDLQGEFPVLRETNCPYHDLAQRDSGICELEQQVFEQVLGTSLKLASCCRDGQACCEFHPVPAV